MICLDKFDSEYLEEMKKIRKHLVGVEKICMWKEKGRKKEKRRRKRKRKREEGKGKGKRKVKLGF